MCFVYYHTLSFEVYAHNIRNSTLDTVTKDTADREHSLATEHERTGYKNDNKLYLTEHAF